MTDKKKTRQELRINEDGIKLQRRISSFFHPVIEPVEILSVKGLRGVHAYCFNDSFKSVSEHISAHLGFSS